MTDLVTNISLIGLRSEPDGVVVVSFQVEHEGDGAPPPEVVSSEVDEGGFGPGDTLQDYFNDYHEGVPADDTTAALARFKTAQAVDHWIAQLFESELLASWSSGTDLNVRRFPRDVALEAPAAFKSVDSASPPTIASDVESGDPVGAALTCMQRSGFISSYADSPTTELRGRLSLTLAGHTLPVPVACQTRSAASEESSQFEFTVEDKHLRLWKESEGRRKTATLKGLLLVPTVRVGDDFRFAASNPIVYVGLERLFHVRRLQRTLFKSSGGRKKSVTLVLEPSATGNGWQLRSKGTKGVIVPLAHKKGVWEPVRI